MSVMNHSVFICPNWATNANNTAYNSRCTAFMPGDSRLVSSRHRVTPIPSASSSTNYLKQGYVQISGNPAEFIVGRLSSDAYCVILDWARLCLGLRSLLMLERIVQRRLLQLSRKTSLPSRKKTVSSIHGCSWRRRTA